MRGCGVRLHCLGVGLLRGAWLRGLRRGMGGVSIAASALRAGRLVGAWGSWVGVYHSVKFLGFC